MGAEWGVREVEVGKNPTGGGSMRWCALVNWWRILPSWLFWRAVLVAGSLGDQIFENVVVENFKWSCWFTC